MAHITLWLYRCLWNISLSSGWFELCGTKTDIEVFLKMAGVVTIQIKTDGFTIPKPIDNHSTNANWKWSSKLFWTTWDGLNAALTLVQMEWFWLAAVWQKSRDACPKATRKAVKSVSQCVRTWAACLVRTAATQINNSYYRERERPIGL